QTPPTRLSTRASKRLEAKQGSPRREQRPAKSRALLYPTATQASSKPSTSAHLGASPPNNFRAATKGKFLPRNARGGHDSYGRLRGHRPVRVGVELIGADHEELGIIPIPPAGQEGEKFVIGLRRAVERSFKIQVFPAAAGETRQVGQTNARRSARCSQGVTGRAAGGGVKAVQQIVCSLRRGEQVAHNAGAVPGSAEAHFVRQEGHAAAVGGATKDILVQGVDPALRRVA